MSAELFKFLLVFEILIPVGLFAWAVETFGWRAVLRVLAKAVGFLILFALGFMMTIYGALSAVEML